MGIQIKRYFFDRLKFYESMLLFCEYAIKEISFYNTTKDKILNGYSDRILTNVIEGRDEKILSKEENIKIKNFLDSIGKFDAKNEVQNIEFYKIYLNNQKQKCSIDYDKKSGLALKLSILIGILLCILLI